LTRFGELVREMKFSKKAENHSQVSGQRKSGW
jgi:hypothetical protein